MASKRKPTKKKKDLEQNITPPSTTKRIKVQAQRKFAQGAPVIPIQITKESYTSLTSPTHNSVREAAIFKVNGEEKTYTEDFLTFLCFKDPNRSRSRPAFPFTYQTKVFVPNGVRKQATETPAPAPSLESKSKDGKPSSSSQDKERNSHSGALSRTKQENVDRVQTRSKAAKIFKTIRNKKFNGQTVNKVRLIRKTAKKPVSKVLIRRVNSVEVNKKNVPTQSGESQTKIITKKALIKIEPMKTRSSGGAETIGRVKGKPPEAKVITSRRHYITRRTTVPGKTNVAGESVLYRTRSGFVRRIAVPLKRKVISKSPNKEPTPKQDFSSDDDKPLFKTIKEEQVATPTKKTTETPVLSKKHVTRKSVPVVASGPRRVPSPKRVVPSNKLAQFKTPKCKTKKSIGEDSTPPDTNKEESQPSTVVVNSSTEKAIVKKTPTKISPISSRKKDILTKNADSPVQEKQNNVEEQTVSPNVSTVTKSNEQPKRLTRKSNVVENKAEKIVDVCRGLSGDTALKIDVQKKKAPKRSLETKDDSFSSEVSSKKDKKSKIVNGHNLSDDSVIQTPETPVVAKRGRKPKAANDQDLSDISNIATPLETASAKKQKPKTVNGQESSDESNILPPPKTPVVSKRGRKAKKVNESSDESPIVSAIAVKAPVKLKEKIKTGHDSSDEESPVIKSKTNVVFDTKERKPKLENGQETSDESHVLPSTPVVKKGRKKKTNAQESTDNSPVVQTVEKPVVNQVKTSVPESLEVNGKRKRKKKSIPDHVMYDSDIESEVSNKKRSKRSTLVKSRTSTFDKPGTSGVSTRTRSNKVNTLDTTPKKTLTQNYDNEKDEFTDSDERPLASKISDTINNKSCSTKAQNNIVSSNVNDGPGPSTSNANRRLSILIDNETKEMVDRRSKMANTADSIDSSFNLNHGVRSQTSSSSVDESGNITVQPEMEPPIENLRHVMKRSENVDGERMPNNIEKEDETLQQSLESCLRVNHDTDRNKKFMKSREYIDDWIIESAGSISCSLFLQWLVKISPQQFADLAARYPQLAQRYQELQSQEPGTCTEENEVHTHNFNIEEAKEEEQSHLQESQQPIENITPNVGNALAVAVESRTVVEPSINKDVNIEKETKKPEKSTKEPVVSAENTVALPTPSVEEPPAVASTSNETKKNNSKPAVPVEQQQVFDVYDFDSESELSAHNASEEFGWKPKGARDSSRPHRPIPSFSSIRKRLNEKSPKASAITNATHQDPSTSKGNTNNQNKNETNTSDSKNNPEGHTFFIPLDGIDTTGPSVDNMIGGVAVQVGTQEGPNQRVIMTAKLVTRSELDVTKNVSESLANQAGPVRDMVNSCLPAGFRNTFTPVNLTTPEPIPLPMVNDETLHAGTDDVTARHNHQTGRRSSQVVPQNDTNFPDVDDDALMVDAPVFRPNELEFQDPLEYIERITPIASKFGICKIIPPSGFQSECNVWEDMRFTPHNQYVHRMLHRWGPSSRQMCAIKKYLATQGVTFSQPPKLSGIEVDLPKLYHVVQNLGGLKRVLEKKLWMRVAEEMCIPFNAHYMDFRLDEIYCKYLLPYDTLSNEERQKLFESVDKEWELRHQKLIARAANPMNCPEEDEDDGKDGAIDVTEDIEECVTRGKSTTLGSFARLAKNIISMQFGKTAEPTPDEVEKKFWVYVTNRNSHICVNSGSIDSSVWGYGFPSAKAKGNNIAKHPWNLKVLTNNNSSVLRSLGPMVGVTAPTLHVGMAFSACCWYRDPHGLPWIEFLHQGAPKVWYGVPSSHSQKFRWALSTLVPGLCQQKTIWLLSDTAMVPPALLTSNGVSLCRTVQQPGEFVIVFPKAFSSSICTGYSISESVYFALPTWLQTAHQDFTDIRNSCEPSMFSLERLMVAISEDPRSSYQVLKQVLPALNKITQQEKQHRETLFNLGLKTSERAQLTLTGKKKMAKRQDEAEECQRCRTNLSLSMLYHTSENVAYCLTHGAEYLEANREQVDVCKLIFMHSIEELQTIMSKLIQRINNLANKKVPKGKNLS